VGAILDELRIFLNSDWPHRALALGWTAHDLFGCDRDRPFAGIDRLGLLWLIRDGASIALTADVAAIETVGGARQTYRRSSDEHAQVLPRELAE
jgi:hypothetical protein